MPRVMIAIKPNVHEAIKLVARRKTLTVRDVSDRLIRYGLEHIDFVFPNEKHTQKENL